MSVTKEIVRRLALLHSENGKFRFNLQDLDVAHMVGANEDAFMLAASNILHRDHGLVLFPIEAGEYALATPAEIEAEGGVMMKPEDIEAAGEVLETAEATAQFIESKLNGKSLH